MKWSAGLLLAAAIALAVAGPARAQDAPPRPAPAEEQSHQFSALERACKEQRWEDVRRLGTEALASIKEPQWRVELLAMVARASAEVERWDDCLRLCDQYEVERKAAKGDPDLRGKDQVIRFSRGMSFLGLGRATEARATLDGLWRDIEDPRGTIRSRMALAVARAEGAFSVDDEYHGKYEGDPRLPAGMDSLRKALPVAVARVRRRLGRPELPIPPLVVSFLDSEGLHLWASSDVMNRGGKGVGTIVVISEVAVTGAVDPVEILAHELAHVICTTGVPDGDLPEWVEEGVAAWLAREDEEGLRAMVLQRAIFPPEVAKSERMTISRILEDESLLTGQDTFTHMVCGAVVLFQIERERGAEATRRLVLRLLGEKDWKAVLREECGCPPEDLFKSVRKGYLEWAGRTFAGAGVVDEASRLSQAGKAKEAIPLLEEWLNSHPGAADRADVEYQRAGMLLLSGDGAAAVEAYRRFRREHPRHYLLVSSMMAEAEGLRAIRDWKALRDLMRLVLRDYTAGFGPARKKEAEEILAESEKRLAEAVDGAGTTPGGK